MEDTVDYRLQRQRQQDARFKSRGATWKPSGKPCTLQFVFDEVSKRPPVDSEEHDTAHISHSEPTKARNPTATRVQSPPVLTGKLLHMKQKIQQTEGDKFSNIDASKTRILSKVDKDDSPTESPNLITTTAPFGPPRKAHKSVKAVEPDVIEHPVKKLTNPRIHSKQGFVCYGIYRKAILIIYRLTATVSKQVEAIDFIEQSPSSSSEAEQPPPKPRQKKSTKTLKAKPSTPQSNHSSDDDHIPSDSPPKPSKRIRPKESKAKEAKVGPGRSKGNVNVSKKRCVPGTWEVRIFTFP